MSRRASALALALALLLSLLPTFAAADPPPPTGISVAPSPAIAYLGEPLALTATLRPGTAQSAVKWSSSNTQVARVSQDGLVTPVKSGTATITATTARGGKYARVALKVVDRTMPTGLSVAPSPAIAYLGEPLALTATLRPDTAQSAVKWSSSNTGVARVSQGGLVTPVKAGSVTITATAARGGRYARVALKVIDRTMPTGLSIAPSSAATTYLGEKLALTATLRPDTAKSSVKWRSSNTGVARVSQGGLVTPVKAGSVTITATTARGNKAAKVTVRIIDRTMPTGLSIAPPSEAIANLGEKLALTAILRPDTAKSTVKWASSNAKVATVSSGGIVTPVKVGSVRITATTARGSKRATVTVRVQNPTRPSHVELIGGQSELVAGQSMQLGYALAPDDAVSSISWVSSNANVLTVRNGLVCAIRPGVATVNAVAVRGGRRAMLRVRVLPDPAADPAPHLPLEGMVIGIDPGHQSREDRGLEPVAPGSREMKKKVSAGACGVKTRIDEYVTVLQIGLKLRDRLAALGAEVYMTRTSHGVNLSNIARAQMMNEVGAHLVLRLHCNASSSKATTGLRLYVASRYGPTAESYRAACALMPAMGKASGVAQRGITRSSKYSGLNWSTVPSVLVEMGYISNPTEDVRLNSGWYQDKMVTGMIHGACDYLGYARP